MPPSTAELLAHATWLRRLAASLVGDGAADDLVQETWIAALRSPPAAERPIRPWLQAVARNLARMRWRSTASRDRREAASEPPEPSLSPEDVVARAETQQRLVQLVLAMAEPYRSTLLLRFFEGLEPTEIARRLDVPAGTVRWRLKEALARLRTQLDAAHAGDRRAWLGALAPLAQGALVAKTSSSLVSVVVAILLLMLVAGLGAGAWALRRAPAGARQTAALATAGDVTRPGGPRARSPSGDGAGAAVDLPAVLAPDPAAPARRVAGRVTHDDLPLAGVTVHLATTLAPLGLGPDRSLVTDARGHFDFGLLPAYHVEVSASTPGLRGAGVSLALADPELRPAPDQLDLRLGGCQLGLAGRVLDPAGGPIVGARLRYFLGFGGDDPAAVAVSGADGRYALCVAGGLFGLRVEADGYGGLQDVLLVQQGHEARDFVLTPEAVTVGRVVDGTGQAVEGAVVVVSPAVGGRERSAERSAVSDAGGRFRISGLAPGKHRLYALASGLATDVDLPLVLVAGESREVTVRLQARARVSGVVMEHGRPVAGARVSLLGTSDRWSSAALTRADGRFSLDRVPLGQVRFDAPPFEVITPQHLSVGGAGARDVVVQVEARARLAGRVSRQGKPVADAEVTLASADHFEVLRSDGAGRFERGGLPPGHYTLTPMSQEAGAGGDEVTVDLGRGEAREGLELTLSAGATISGRVLDDEGRPLVDAVVEWKQRGTQDVGWSPTDADGRYRAWAMTGGGDYLAVVHPQLGAPETLAPAAGPFPVIPLAGADSHVEGVDLRVHVQRRSLIGRVVDAAGAPVADARVELSVETSGEPDFESWRKPPHTVSDTEGRFRLDGLAASSYALRVQAAAGAALLRRVAPGSAERLVRLDASGTIRGRVVGFAAPPVVYAWRGDRDSDYGTAVDAQGAFTLQDLAPGRWTVVALGEGGEGAATSTEVRGGVPAEITLTSPGRADVEGRVLDLLTGAPLAGLACAVRVRADEDRPLPYWRGPREPTGSDGAFSRPDAPAGAVEIACDADDTRSSAVITTTLAPGTTWHVDLFAVTRRAPAEPLAYLGASPAPDRYATTLAAVEPGSPAAAAGLTAGDTIVAVDGRDVSRLAPDGLGWLVDERAPGATVRLAVRRGAGGAREVLVTLRARPDGATATW